MEHTMADCPLVWRKLLVDLQLCGVILMMDLLRGKSPFRTYSRGKRTRLNLDIEVLRT